MKKINKTHLVLTLVLLVVLLIPLVNQFDNFMFHTYETKVFQKNMYYGIHDDVSMDYYSFIENENGYQFGKGKLTINNEEFLHDGDELEVTSRIGHQTFNHQLEKIGNVYHLDYIMTQEIDKAKNIELIIFNKTTQNTINLPLSPTNLNVYSGQNKDFTVKELYTYKDRMQLGSINCANLDKWMKDYQKVRIEYRYKKPDALTDDQYVVFHKQTGTLEEMFNHHSTEFIDVKIAGNYLLEDLELSMVIVLEGESHLAFSIDLDTVSEVES